MNNQTLLQVSDFVLPFSAAQTQFSVLQSNFVTDASRFDMHEGRLTESIAEPSNNAPGSQEANLFHTFSALVLSGKVDPAWPRITLLTQRVLDACLLSASRDGAPVILG